MKVYLCVTPFFPGPQNWRGAYILDQIKAIQRNSDYKVIVFKTNSLTRFEDDYEVDGIRVYPIRPLLMPSYILNGLTEKIVGYLFVKKLKKLKINLKDIAFIHCHTANHAAFGFGVRGVNPEAKVLLQFHDLDPYSLRNGFMADKRWNVRYRARKSLCAFERVDLLISISTPVQDNLLAFPNARPNEIHSSYLSRLQCLLDYPSLKSHNTYILYNGVDTTKFNVNRYSVNLESDLFRIGCIANFQEIKDHITLIKAFEILIKKGYGNMRLSLLGSGETLSECKAYIKAHNLDEYVEWPNEVSHSKLPDYYRSLSLFVLPSVYEGFGCVYTEAYACGVPFIGVYDQGAAELLDPAERDNWLIKPHDHIGLADRVERYYTMRMKQTLSQPYDIDTLIKKFLNYIHQI